MRDFLKLYHVAALADFPAILEKGLKADEEGEIFLVNDKKYAAGIASLKYGLQEYALFEIRADSLFKEGGKIAEIAFGECTCKIKAPTIPKEKIRFIDCYSLKTGEKKVCQY